jgi:hypothetical protein
MLYRKTRNHWGTILLKRLGPGISDNEIVSAQMVIGHEGGGNEAIMVEEFISLEPVSKLKILDILLKTGVRCLKK